MKRGKLASTALVAGFTPAPLLFGAVLFGTQVGVRVAVVWLTASVVVVIYGCIFVDGGGADASRGDPNVDNARD